MCSSSSPAASAEKIHKIHRNLQNYSEVVNRGDSPDASSALLCCFEPCCMSQSVGSHLWWARFSGVLGDPCCDTCHPSHRPSTGLCWNKIVKANAKLAPRSFSFCMRGCVLQVDPCRNSFPSFWAEVPGSRDQAFVRCLFISRGPTGNRR